MTIPASLRKKIKIKPSDRVSFRVDKNQLILEKVPSIDDLAGSLANPKVKPLTNNKLKELIDKGLFSDN